MTSHDLVQMLRLKHAEDVFVPECKNGSTWMSNHVRLDVWVMRKSWTNMSCIGYEIKVSRSDFLNDSKWHKYLDLCNEFSFVCPMGLISPDELPQDVGLYWASKNGARLFCKRKPVFRKVTIPESLFRYILMCRTTIKNESNPISKREEWENWLKKKDEEKHIGRNVSKKIQELVNLRIKKVESENDRLKEMYDKYDAVIKQLANAGIDAKSLDKWRLEYAITQKIKEINSGIPEGLDTALLNMERNISFIKKVLLQNAEEQSLALSGTRTKQ